MRFCVTVVAVPPAVGVKTILIDCVAKEMYFGERALLELVAELVGITMRSVADVLALPGVAVTCGAGVDTDGATEFPPVPPPQPAGASNASERTRRRIMLSFP